MEGVDAIAARPRLAIAVRGPELGSEIKLRSLGGSC